MARFAFLDNPVVLRDLGWAYYPPVLGRFTRWKVQVLAALAVFATVVGVAVALGRTGFGMDAAAFVLLAFGVLGHAVLFLRSLITALGAWRSERTLHGIEELTLTRLTASEIVGARVFARGFAFVAGHLFCFALVAVGLLLGGEGGNPRQFCAILGVFALLPPLGLLAYVHVLAAALHRQFAVVRAIARLALLFGAIACLIGVIVGSLVLIDNLVTDVWNSRSVTVMPLLVPAWCLTAALWCRLAGDYRRLILDTQRLFLGAQPNA